MILRQQIIFFPILGGGGAGCPPLLDHFTLCSLHTRLRHQCTCSFLKADLTKIHIEDDPKCSCCSPNEDAIHFHLECQLYYNQRISLFNDLINMNIEINIETLLFGNDTYTDHTNSKINLSISISCCL